MRHEEICEGGERKRVNESLKSQVKARIRKCERWHWVPQLRSLWVLGIYPRHSLSSLIEALVLDVCIDLF